MLTVGSDVEVFLRDDYQYLPCLNLTKGTKESPEPLGDDVFIQRDNLSLEINTKPASSADEFVKNIQIARKKTLVFLKKKIPEVRFYESPIVKLNDSFFIHKEAMEMGCDPDFNAWKEASNPVVSAVNLGYVRTLSGHIHIGHPDVVNMTEKEKFTFIRTLDMVVGSFLVRNISHVSLSEFERRKFYGMAGSMRFKPYGVEWRVPSCSWFSKHTYHAKIFNLIKFCVEYWDLSEKILITGLHKTYVQETINNSQSRQADKILTALKERAPDEYQTVC